MNNKIYFNCPTQNTDCPYWCWKRHKCSMPGGPEGECDEYDAYTEDENEEE